MSDALQAVADVVHRTSGVMMGAAQMRLLEGALQRAAPGRSPAQVLDAVNAAGASSALLDRLIDEVTIKETFFFRHSAELQAIDWHGLREAALRGGRRTVRVWSAACASGEEPYSLAILAARTLGDDHDAVSILATDIADSALRRAAAGEYGWRSVQRVDDLTRQEFFEPTGDGLRVGPELRARVRCARHNLVRDNIPPPGEGRFDLIVCRNVFIYFDPKQVARTICALEGALEMHGMLILGAADRLARPLSRRADDDARSGRRYSPPGGERRGDSERRAGRQRHGRREGGVPSSGSTDEGQPVTEERRHSGDRRSGIERREPHEGPPATGLGEASASVRDDSDATAILARALAAADTGRLAEAIAASEGLLQLDPLDPSAHYVLGLAELSGGDQLRGIEHLRRCLYLCPTFGLAAYVLAGAHEARGDLVAALRGYRQALRLLPGASAPHPVLVEAVNHEDLVAACRARLVRIEGVYGGRHG